MSDFDNPLLVDDARSCCLCDVGGPGLIATVALDSDGTEHLVLADRDRIGDDTARVDTSCQTVEHEQVGQLPIDFVRRITVSRRTFRCSPDTLRCGRRTKSGRPCRIPVMFDGDACAWHRSEAAK